MREVTQYEADDGTMHATEEECVAYEQAQSDGRRVAAWIATMPREGEGAVSGRARTARANAAMEFLAWERGQRGGTVAEAAE